MDSLHASETMIFLIMLLIVQCESKTEIGDYIVDCSACQFAPLIEVESYSCMVRCEAQGNICLRMVVYEKIYFDAYPNYQYIWHKNNTTHLYFYKLQKFQRSP